MPDIQTIASVILYQSMSHKRILEVYSCGYVRSGFSGYIWVGVAFNIYLGFFRESLFMHLRDFKLLDCPPMGQVLFESQIFILFSSWF